MNSKLLFLLALNLHYTASADCSNIQIKSESDISQFSDCKEAGKVTISGSIEKVSLNLQKANSIDASKTENLRSVSMDNLEEVDDIHIENNKGLETLSFAKLKELKSLSVVGNPVMSSMKAALKKAENIEFTNNGISKIEGMDLERVNSLTLTSNPNLDKFSSKAEKMDGYLYVSGNNPKLELSLPSLQSIGGNVTISNCTSVDLSKLSSIDNMVNIVGNHFTKFVANNLTSISSSFSFVSNENIKELSMEGLTTIGGALLISNNTELGSIKFDKLEELRGTLDVTGDFKTLELPALNMISGGANVQSKDGSLECDKLANVKSITNGKFTCEGKVKDPKSKTSVNSTSSNTKSSSASHTQLLSVSQVFFFLSGAMAYLF